MTDAPLVLSLFPGIGLLDRAFEEEGFTVVRGPDVLWGGDVRRFHPPAGRFEEVIGGPPCQAFSRMRHLNPRAGGETGNLIPEYERCVREARPEWFLMENVRDAPLPVVAGYVVRDVLLNNRWVAGDDGALGAEQHRIRRISFGTPDGRPLPLEVAPLEAPLWAYAVTSHGDNVPVKRVRDGQGGHKPKRKRVGVLPPAAVTCKPMGLHSREARGIATGYSIAEMCRLQGLPDDFADGMPFTAEGKRRVLGNGVPMATGLAVARAVKRALGNDNGT